MQSQATTYARLARSPALKNSLLADSTEVEKNKDELQVTVLPVSAENAGLLPNREGNDDLCCVVGFPYHDCLMISVLDTLLRVFYLAFVYLYLCMYYGHMMFIASH